MAKRAARAAQTGFDIGGHAGNGRDGNGLCRECDALEGEVHAEGCPYFVGADAGGAVLKPASPEAAALARELQEQPGRVQRVDALNAQVRWSTDAVGTWFFLMDGEQPLPLRVYGPDQAAERDRLLSVLQRAGDGGDHTGDGHGKA